MQLQITAKIYNVYSYIDAQGHGNIYGILVDNSFIQLESTQLMNETLQ